MSIVGVLAAVAVPQYQGYKSGGFDKRAQLTLRNVATAEEAYFVDFGIYITCDQTNCQSKLKNLDPIPSGVTLQITATASGFDGTASHVQGSGTVFTW